MPRKIPRLVDSETLIEPDLLLDEAGSKPNAFKLDDCETALQRALETLTWYKGKLRMRARLGKLFLTRYRKNVDEMSFSAFEKMMGMPQVQGTVTSEIGNGPAEEIMHQSLAAKRDSLAPISSLSFNQEHLPTYTCVFTVRLGDGKHYRFEALYAQDFEEEYVCKSKFWMRLDEDNKLTKLLDLTLVDLAQDSAWQLDVLSGYTIEVNLPEMLRLFAEGVNLKADAAQLSTVTNEQYFTYRLVPGVTLVDYQQRKCFAYNFVKGPYVCEASITQNFYPAPDPEREIPDQVNLVCQSPRGSLSVFHRQWDTTLAENANLPIGKPVKWAPELKTFFPEDDIAITGTEDGAKPGFAGFVQRLQEIESIVCGSYPSDRFAYSPTNGATNGNVVSPANQLTNGAHRAQKEAKQSTATTSIIHIADNPPIADRPLQPTLQANGHKPNGLINGVGNQAPSIKPNDRKGKGRVVA